MMDPQHADRISLATGHPAPDGEATALTEQDIVKRLPLVPDWTIEGGRLLRDLKVTNFKAALALVNRVAQEAEAENHHPDMCIHSWNRVRLELYTHTLHGLSDNDFVMAARFDRIIENG